MAWVVKSRPAELSSCRRAFSKELRGRYRRDDVRDGLRRVREGR